MFSAVLAVKGTMFSSSGRYPKGAQSTIDFNGYDPVSENIVHFIATRVADLRARGVNILSEQATTF